MASESIPLWKPPKEAWNSWTGAGHKHWSEAFEVEKDVRWLFNESNGESLTNAFEYPADVGIERSIRNIPFNVDALLSIAIRNTGAKSCSSFEKVYDGEHCPWKLIFSVFTSA